MVDLCIRPRGTHARHRRAPLADRPVALCGAYYVFLGATALGVAGIPGVLGGVLVWAAMAAARRWGRAAYPLLVLGALRFALSTWWSVITPLIAILALAIGHVAVRQTSPAKRTAT